MNVGEEAWERCATLKELVTNDPDLDRETLTSRAKAHAILPEVTHCDASEAVPNSQRQMQLVNKPELTHVHNPQPSHQYSSDHLVSSSIIKCQLCCGATEWP